CRAEYRTPLERDPFAVPLSDKVDLCLRAEAALAQPGVTLTKASVRALREYKVLVSSDGVEIEQEHVETGAGIDAVAAGDGRYQIRSYPSAVGGSSVQGGWEYGEGVCVEEEAPRIAEQAVALLRADPCPDSVTTVVI